MQGMLSPLIKSLYMTYFFVNEYFMLLKEQ